jgi:hypothetical protein
VDPAEVLKALGIDEPVPKASSEAATPTCGGNGGACAMPKKEQPKCDDNACEMPKK